jgi:hypothetical protein
VQEFPPAINAGAFLIGESARGPILPAYGTKERDRMLRVYDQMEFNNIWQGAIAGLIKKTPLDSLGDPRVIRTGPIITRLSCITRSSARVGANLWRCWSETF